MDPTKSAPNNPRPEIDLPGNEETADAADRSGAVSRNANLRVKQNRGEYYWTAVLVIGYIVLAVGLRVVALGSDAYARLSWSSGLLTDEGFYIHNARNQVLFGQAHLDGFNNDLIMPVLHYLQVGVFKAFGVGAIQARLISVVLSLLGLPVFFAALRRAFGVRVGVLGVVLLGLDHANLLYSRLALMDPAGAFVLILVFYAFVRGQRPEGGAEKAARAESRGGLWWLLVCGFLLGVGYGVRGLTALVMPVPLLVLGWAGWRSRSGWRGYEGLVSCGLGLCLSMGIYLLAWYLPHHQELATVNRYYLQHQLIPHGLESLRQNITHAYVGDERGLSPSLFRHMPVEFGLVLAGGCWWFQRMAVREKGKGKREKRERHQAREEGRGKRKVRGRAIGEVRLCGVAPAEQFLWLWLLAAWVVLSVISYSPSRYYVLFYPAMAGCAALVLDHLWEAYRALASAGSYRALLGGFLAYHLGEAVLHHRSPLTDGLLIGFTVLAGWLAWRLGLRWKDVGNSADRLVPVTSVLLLVWCGVNLAWIGDWLGHLTYAQRDADRWLAANLPAGSVLLGDAAPGLCLNNSFKVVNVIPELCNDQAPVERYTSGARYIVILDGAYKEPYWQKHYAGLVARDRRLHLFPEIVRFPVGVYAVDRSAALMGSARRRAAEDRRRAKRWEHAEEATGRKG